MSEIEELKEFYKWDYLELLSFMNYLELAHSELVCILFKDFKRKYGGEK